ncbi:MAG: hypothetical protein V3U82_05790 [Robiginitomaculum sp.]
MTRIATKTQNNAASQARAVKLLFAFTSAICLTLLMLPTQTAQNGEPRSRPASAHMQASFAPSPIAHDAARP